MAEIKELVHVLYNARALIEWGGLVLVASFLFAETGLFAGFFLPGDSLLVSAGILSKAGAFPLIDLLFWASLAAVAGNQVNYAFGLKAGRPLFNRPDSLFFKKSHLLKAHDFYERYGAKTIVLARFVPIVRTFAPLAAGIAAMDRRKFFLYNLAGGLLWVCGLSLGGYSLAAAIPHVERRLHWVILIVILLSLLPPAFEVLRGIKNKRRAPRPTESTCPKRRRS